MRNLTNKTFNPNSPMRNYYTLSEQIEDLNKKIRDMEQNLIDVRVRINEKNF